jgi:uncharacterized protein (TIGR02145 family)/prepilin-type N-terminal cleavage/methylation domain-containing protein
MNKQKQAFTLVELIVVITILAILGTIAFISLQWYSTQARDSTRVNDLASMKSSLELYQLEAGKYPQPTNGIDITYSWAIVWSQGTFWETVYSNVKKLDKIPTDPLTDKEYTYSVTTIKTEYQLWGILEWDEVSFSSAASSPLTGRIRPLGHPVERGVLNTETNAWETIANAIVTWNYNWVITKTNSWTLCNILATPSIITNDTSVTDLQQIVTNSSFVYRWYKNLPGSFNWSKFKQDWWFAFQPNNLSVYTDNNNCGDITAKTSSWTTARVQLLKWLQDAYTWTILKEVWEIKNIADLVIDTNNPSQEVINYGWNFVNNNLWWKIVAGGTIQTPASTTCTSWQWFNWTSCITATECADWLESLTLSNWQTWSCKNMWATEVWDWTTNTFTSASCISSSDCSNKPSWFWDYYQRWRNDPVNTDTIVATYNWAFTWLLWHNNFVDWENWYWDWWQDEAWSTTPNRWTWINPQWPCPTDWHVPSKLEWQDACDTISNNGCTTTNAMKWTLRLPFAGNRDWTDGYYYNMSTVADYWSSTPYSDNAYYLYFDVSNNIFPDFDNDRGNGFSVRCLKN